MDLLKKLPKHNKFAGLLFTLIGMLLAYPLFESHEHLAEIFRFLVLATMTTAVLVLATTRTRVWASLLLVVPVLILNGIPLFAPVPALAPLRMTLFVLFGFYTLYTIFHHILVMTRDELPDNSIFYAAAAGYILFGATWGAFYHGLETLEPGSFLLVSPRESHLELIWTDFVYYSFTTLTTLGYGDIVPVSSLARSLSISEAVMGVMYVSLFVSKLISFYTTTRFERSVNTQNKACETDEPPAAIEAP